MALRESLTLAHAASNRALVSESLASDRLRIDGRSPSTGRPLVLSLVRREGAATAELRMGRTRALAEVTSELVQPFPDRPSEGMLQFGVDFSPMASEGFDAGRPPAAAVELARFIERAVRESQALDTEALCVINAERVWAIKVDVTVLDHDGNFIDACMLAAMAALQHFRRPEVTVSTEGGGDAHDPSARTVVTVHHSDERPSMPLPLHHVPLAVTFALVHCAGTRGEESEELVSLVDPSAREEAVMCGRITFSLNAHNELCALHKLGGAPLSATAIVPLSLVAAERAADLHRWLAAELKAAERAAAEVRATRLRGRTYVAAGLRGNGAGAGPLEPMESGLKHLGYDQLHLTFVTKDDTKAEVQGNEGDNGKKTKAAAESVIKGPLWAAIEVAAGEASGSKRPRREDSAAGALQVASSFLFILPHVLQLLFVSSGRPPPVCCG